MEYVGLLHIEPKQTLELGWMVEKPSNQANSRQNCAQGVIAPLLGTKYMGMPFLPRKVDALERRAQATDSW